MDTYTDFRIETPDDGGAPVATETNDNDDDGYPDAAGVERWDLTYRTLEAAFMSTGRQSHRGYYGQPVRVFLNGEELVERFDSNMPEASPWKDMAAFGALRLEQRGLQQRVVDPGTGRVAASWNLF